VKEVQFVHISAEISGYGMFKGLEYTFKEVEDTIRSRVEAGWEYCGYVPLTTRSVNEGTKTISLIFQREQEPGDSQGEQDNKLF